MYFRNCCLSCFLLFFLLQQIKRHDFLFQSSNDSRCVSLHFSHFLLARKFKFFCYLYLCRTNYGIFANMYACMFGGSALCITKIRSQFTFLLLGGCYVISVLVKSISLNYDHSSVWVLLSETQSHYESLHGVSVLSDDDHHHHCQLTFFRSGGIFIQICYDVQTLNANPKLLSSIDFLHVEH